ncbi:MAG: rhomboid family intramembrane serine protease [Oscillospiraceae bacterium]|nr:rhomboid family intramembrane serine protease [Oscillospiraceae bacterium]
MVTAKSSTLKYFCVYHSSPKEILTYLRLFTHVLGHADFSHFSGNIMLMLVLGPSLEERYGSSSIFLALIITALVSGLFSYMLFPTTALMGASGIVFMMIVMSSLGGMSGDGIPLTLILVFAVYIGGEIVTGITTKDNISQLAHIIGGVVGGIMGIAFRKR